jgi:UDP-2,3-diacylglucosamine hydrolase
MKNITNGKLAVWAGQGSLPLTAALNASREREVLVIAFKETTDIQPYKKSGIPIKLISLAEMGKNFRILRAENVKELVMLGKFPRAFIFGKSSFDLTGLRLLLKLSNSRDMSIFMVLAEELKKQGIKVIPQPSYLGNFRAEHGPLTNRKPSQNMLEDIRYGFGIAKTIADYDIGQTIVVRHKSVIAIESLEGTNETIFRVPPKIGKEAVVIKSARKKQDPRFDIPVVGIETLASMFERNIRTIAVEAGKTILADKPALLQFANRKGICIYGV